MDQCNLVIDFRILSPPRTVTNLYLVPEWWGLLLDFWFHWGNRVKVNVSRECSAAAQLRRLRPTCGSFKTQLWCTPVINSQVLADRPTSFSYLRWEQENSFNICECSCFAPNVPCFGIHSYCTSVGTIPDGVWWCGDMKEAFGSQRQSVNLVCKMDINRTEKILPCCIFIQSLYV